MDRIYLDPYKALAEATAWMLKHNWRIHPVCCIDSWRRGTKSGPRGSKSEI